MKWFLLCLAAGCGPASAACIDAASDALPSQVTFDDGTIVAVVGREERVLSYEVITPAGNVAARFAVEGGLRMLSMVNADGAELTYSWPGNLPDPASLTVGSVIHEIGQPEKPTDYPSEYRVEVTGTETFTLDGCDYPVLVMAFRNGPEDQPISEGVRWFDPRTMLTYHTDLTVKQQGEPDIHYKVTATKIE